VPLESQPEPEPEPEPEPVAAGDAPRPAFTPRPVSVVVEAKPVPERQPEVIEPEPVVPEPEAVEPERSLDVELARSVQGVARYSLDPLGDPLPRRRFARGNAPEPDAVEVPARPEGVRALPGCTNRQD